MRAIQQALIVGGHSAARGGDGLYGPNTWDGVLDFKPKEGLAKLGELTHDGFTVTRLDEIFKHQLIVATAQ